MRFIKDYRPYLCEISKVSFDKNSGVSLIKDDEKEHRLINFDGIKRKLCKEFRENDLFSCDAYIEKDGVRYFIEFKNQNEGNVDRNQIRNKAFDSFSLFLVNENNITGEELAESAVYLVVYNNNAEYFAGKEAYQSAPSINKLTTKLKELSGKTGLERYPKLFGVDRYIGKLYKNVYTVDVKIFIKEFYPLIF